MSRAGNPLILYTQFYDTNGNPLAPTPPVNIRAIIDDTETVSAATQVGTSNVYTRTVTPTAAGIAMWRGETADEDADQPVTAWTIERIVAAVAEPTLTEIVTDLQATGVTLVNPLTLSGELMTVIIGDDYLDADGRAFVWNTAGVEVDLTDATFEWVTGITTQTPTHAGDELSLDLPSTLTTDFVADNYPYAIRATLDSGSVITLTRGTMKVVSPL